MQLFFLPFVETIAQNIPFDRKNQLLQSIVIQIFTSARQVKSAKPSAKTTKTTIIQIYSDHDKYNIQLGHYFDKKSS